jgi:hypothetical protein
MPINGPRRPPISTRRQTVESVGGPNLPPWILEIRVLRYALARIYPTKPQFFRIKFGQKF